MKGGFVSQKNDREWSKVPIPQSGDLLLARISSRWKCGKIALFNYPCNQSCLDQRVVLIRDKIKTDSIFLLLMLGDEHSIKTLLEQFNWCNRQSSKNMSAVEIFVFQLPPPHSTQNRRSPQCLRRPDREQHPPHQNP